MQASCDHQVQHQPGTTLHADRNPLAQPAQVSHGLAIGTFERRIDGTQQKRTYDAYGFKLLPKDALLDSLDVTTTSGSSGKRRLLLQTHFFKPGNPPSGGAMRTARRIASATASAAATPSASIGA